MAKYVELTVEDLRTRVRFPPPPPIKRLTTSKEIQETRMHKGLRVFCCPNMSKLGCCNPTVTDGKGIGQRRGYATTVELRHFKNAHAPVASYYGRHSRPFAGSRSFI